VMVDGDDTYPAASAMELLMPVLRDEADMVVGQRLSTYADDSFRPFHVWGNRLVCRMVNLIFGSKLTDIMSGYRAFNRAVAERLPVVASGFDVETEMTLQLLFRHFVVREAPIAYGARPPGSSSKLQTVPDGLRVLVSIVTLLKAYKPLTFFGTLALITLAVGIAVGAFPVVEFAQFHYVYSVPKAILAASCVILSFLLGSVGMLLHTMNFRILEMTQVLSKQVQRSAVARAVSEGPGLRARSGTMAPPPADSLDHDPLLKGPNPVPLSPDDPRL
jgi:hypothetical protein